VWNIYIYIYKVDSVGGNSKKLQKFVLEGKIS
jgi:hypothetical protein